MLIAETTHTDKTEANSLKGVDGLCTNLIITKGFWPDALRRSLPPKIPIVCHTALVVLMVMGLKLISFIPDGFHLWWERKPDTSTWDEIIKMQKQGSACVGECVGECVEEFLFCFCFFFPLLLRSFREWSRRGGSLLFQMGWQVRFYFTLSIHVVMRI